MTIGDMPICEICEHRVQLIGKPKCKAFPKGIPEDILWGENDHSKPLPNQGNDIVFEPIRKPKESLTNASK